MRVASATVGVVAASVLFADASVLRKAKSSQQSGGVRCGGVGSEKVCNFAGELAGCGPQQRCCLSAAGDYECTTTPVWQNRGEPVSGCPALQQGSLKSHWESCPERQCNESPQSSVTVGSQTIDTCVVKPDATLANRKAEEMFDSKTCTLRDFCAAMVHLDDTRGLDQDAQLTVDVPQFQSYFSAYKVDKALFQGRDAAKGWTLAVRNPACSNGMLEALGKARVGSKCAEAFYLTSNSDAKDKMRSAFTGDWCDRVWNPDHGSSAHFCAINGCDGTSYDGLEKLALATCPEEWSEVKMSDVLGEGYKFVVDYSSKGTRGLLAKPTR